MNDAEDRGRMLPEAGLPRRLVPFVLFLWLLLPAGLVLLAGGLVFLPGGAAFGEDEEEEPALPAGKVRAQVETWLDDLSSEAFAVREAARKGLERYGAQARDLLESRRDDEDMEVRRTVRLLLARAGRPEERPPAPPGDLQALGRVTCKAKGTLPYLLRTIGRDVGATFGIEPDPGETHYEIDLEDVPFFRALEQVAAKAQLVAHGPFDAGGHLDLKAFDQPGEAPSAADGPMRVRVVEVTSVRTLTPPGRYRYVLALDLHWIPSVQIVTWRTPTEVEATASKDRRLEPSATMRSNMTYGISPSARSARLNLHLEAPDGEPVDRLEKLVFTLPVRLRHDHREVRFGPIESLASFELPETRRVAAELGTPDDDVRITLRALERPDGERGPWLVDLLAHLVGETARNSLSVGLEKADGTVQAASGGSRFPGSDGTVGFLARAYGRWEAPPVAVRVSWYHLEEEGTLQFALEGVPLR